MIWLETKQKNQLKGKIFKIEFVKFVLILKIKLLNSPQIFYCFNFEFELKLINEQEYVRSSNVLNFVNIFF